MTRLFKILALIVGVFFISCTDVNRNQKYSENGNPTTVKTGTIIQ